MGSPIGYLLTYLRAYSSESERMGAPLVDGRADAINITKCYYSTRTSGVAGPADSHERYGMNHTGLDGHPPVIMNDS